LSEDVEAQLVEAGLDVAVGRPFGQELVERHSVCYCCRCRSSPGLRRVVVWEGHHMAISTCGIVPCMFKSKWC
jgi:hypothetical protein